MNRFDHDRLESLVQSAALRWGDRLAIQTPRESWTYTELDRWSGQAAQWLAGFGVGAGDRVAIWARKSCKAIACTQAILRLGAAYVPIDPAMPVERALLIAQDCGVRALISERRLFRGQEREIGAPTLWLDDDAGTDSTTWFVVAGMSSAGIQCTASGPASDLAYILYTSGSTGIPKGVCISHSNALAFIRWAVETVAATSESVFSNHAPLNFDLSVFDYYCAFACGAMVSVISEDIAYYGEKLVSFIRSQRISIWYSVPAVLLLMMEHGGLEGETLPDLRTVIFAGEVFPIEPLRRLRQQLPQARFFNFYGPTETNVCTSFEVKSIADDQRRPVPIGKSASGDRVWLIKEDGREAAPGEEGELCVEGPTVMQGYWNAATQSGPYHTGDICRLLEDGNFDYWGRRDQMVKIHGYRVELGEIEAVLSQHPGIRETAVLIQGNGTNANVVAYVVPKHLPAPTLIELKTYCATRLPRYMLVNRVVTLPALPRTPNGKLDRTALQGAAAEH